MPAFLVEAGSGPGCPGSDWQRLSPLNATEGILSALLGLNFKVKGTSGGGTTGKVDKGDLIEADVHRWLVDVDEAPLQWVQQSRAGLVGAGDALGPRVPGGRCRELSQRRLGSRRQCVLRPSSE